MLANIAVVAEIICTLSFLMLWVLLDTHERQYPVLNTIKRICLAIAVVCWPYVMVTFNLFENAM